MDKIVILEPLLSLPSNWPLPAGSSRVVLPHELTQQLAVHPLARDLYPVAFGHYVTALGHQIQRQQHTDYLLIFCHEGRGSFQTSHASGDLQAGQLLLLPSGVSHSYQSSNNEPWSIYWAHFRGSAASACMDYLGVTHQQPRLTLNNWQALLPDVTRLLNLQHQRPTTNSGILAAALLKQLLMQLPELIPATGQSQHAQPGGFQLPALERFMTDNLHKTLSLADLANFVGLSTHHFSKKFRLSTGTSPLRYFNELKVQYACRLLDNTAQSVREIAQALGFDDPYYFSRLFKKTMGVAPRYYRSSYHPRADTTKNPGQEH
ncbi:MAG: AraC family transcriptional regulator [Idiomarina sp.]